MSTSANKKKQPGEVRDAIIAVLTERSSGAAVNDIVVGVQQLIGRAAPSSVRSYLRLNTPQLFHRSNRGFYSLHGTHEVRERAPTDYSRGSRGAPWPSFSSGSAQLFCCDCFDWLREQSANSIQAVVTDPPYGLFEYSPEQLSKLRERKGGVWRIPPAFDGTERAPLPRFTVLRERDLHALGQYFFEWGRALLPVLVPGANVVVASNPLLSYIVSSALARSGLERRGELVRMVMTMRGGDRPKAAHEEFSGVSVMPRSMWEPWLLFRKPLEGRAQDNLRKWRTGGFRRPNADRPFGDVIKSAPTNKRERELAPHPSLKPQEFLRDLVRGVLPLGEGVVLDPFAGSGSTLAAAISVGYTSIGLERDDQYFSIAQSAIPKLAAYKTAKP